MDGRRLALGHHDPPPLVDQDLQVAERLASAHLPAIIWILSGKGLRIVQMRRIFLLAVRNVGFAEHPRQLQHRRLLPEFLRRKGRALVLHRSLCQDGHDSLSLRRGVPFYSLLLFRINAVPGQNTFQEVLTGRIQRQCGENAAAVPRLSGVGQQKSIPLAFPVTAIDVHKGVCVIQQGPGPHGVMVQLPLVFGQVIPSLSVAPGDGFAAESRRSGHLQQV